MKRTQVVLFVLLVLIGSATPAGAADPITVTSNTFTNNFRQDLKFELRAQSDAGKISQIAIFIQINGVASVARQTPVFTPGQHVQATYEWSLTSDYLPPGVTGEFWWTLEDDAGSKLTTDKQSFRVEDASKPWRKLANERFALYWYNGDSTFGQSLFDRGIQAMEYLEKDIGITVDTQIQAFIYGDRTSFMDALRVGAQEWTGGVAFSDYGIILINVAVTNLEWGKNSTTHELTHQVIGQKIRSPLGRLSMPTWINEGLAEYYEAYPAVVAPQSKDPLARAIRANTVPALRTLSGTFPADADATDLAYAQSYSTVDFIFRRYGKEKMAALLQEFKKGGDYDSIFQRVLGVTVDELDNEWRKGVGLAPRALPTRASAQPTPFPTFSLSTDDWMPTTQPASKATSTVTTVAGTVSPPAQAVVSTPTNTALPTQTPTSTATPRPSATSTPATETSLVLTDDYGSTCALQSEDTPEHMHGCEAGEYVILSKVVDDSWGVLYPDQFDDFVLEADARVVSGTGLVGYGLWLRSSKDGKAYLLTIYQQGGYRLEATDGNNWKDVIPITKTDVVRGGNDKNHIQVTAQGSQIALFLNGQFLDTVTDSTVAGGRIGYLMMSQEPNVKVAFDNLTISKINRPLALPAPKEKTPGPTPMPTIPTGMGGLVVFNYYGQEMNIDVAGKLYKVPGNGSLVIHLPPGKHNWSADIPGLGRAGATVEIEVGRYTSQSFAAR